MKRHNFNNGWRYAKQGDPFTLVTLPHDAMLHEPRAADAPSGSAQGYFPGGRYVYEKTFTAPDGWQDKHIVFQFEGVYKNASVLLNGKRIGGAAYGYIPFFCCADEALCDGDNLLRVTCENTQQPDSRWYTGAGIYRPTWLWTGEKTHIPPEGVRISTVSIDPAMVRVQTLVPFGDVHVEILDQARVLASGHGSDVSIPVPNAQLWSAQTPRLYDCRVTLSVDGKVVDESTTAFGIRQITWDNRGFYMNGEAVLLRGGCLHHDNGILGAATHDESDCRRVKLLKEAGFNAIRSSHNPASRAMLEACDHLGMYVIDETWDMWFHHKSKHDYAQHWRENYLSDLCAIVNRDFNHPSVIMHSIGNEVSEPAKEEGMAVAREMIDFLHQEDATRPVTGGFNLMIIASAKKGKGVYKEEGGMQSTNDQKMQGMNSTMFNMIASMVGTHMNKSANSRKADEATSPLLDALDLAGYNYASGRYAKEGKLHPDRLIYGSETFPQDIWKNWQMVKKYPWLVGDFMWTAMDYLGEAGLGAWAYTADGKGFSKPYPWLLADCGVFDILGNPTGEVYLAQAAWGMLNKPAIAVRPVNHPGIKPIKMTWRGTNAIPSWSWQGCEGNDAVVEVYFDCPSIRLELNGRIIGKKKSKEGKASFRTKYAPGTLTAIALDKGDKEIGRNQLVSAENAVLTVKFERSAAKPGDILYIPVTIQDGQGNVESNADQNVSVGVEGGELLGFGSSNPRSEERFVTGKGSTYYGHALAIVRAGSPGKLSVSARIGEKTSVAEIIIS